MEQNGTERTRTRSEAGVGENEFKVSRRRAGENAEHPCESPYYQPFEGHDCFPFPHKMVAKSAPRRSLLQVPSQWLKPLNVDGLIVHMKLS